MTGARCEQHYGATLAGRLMATGGAYEYVGALLAARAGHLPCTCDGGSCDAPGGVHMAGSVQMRNSGPTPKKTAAPDRVLDALAGA